MFCFFLLLRLPSFPQIPLSNNLPKFSSSFKGICQVPSFFCWTLVFHLPACLCFHQIFVLLSFHLSSSILILSCFLFLPFHWSIPLFSHMSISQFTGHKSAALLHQSTVLSAHKRATPQWVCIYGGGGLWINCIYVQVHLFHVSYWGSMLLGSFFSPPNI